MVVKKRQGFTVKEISCHSLGLIEIEFCRPHDGKSVDASLLINLSNTFDVADIISGLGKKKAGVMSLYLAMGLLFLHLNFKGLNLCFGKNVIFFCGPFLKTFQAKALVFEAVTELDASHATWTDVGTLSF